MVLPPRIEIYPCYVKPYLQRIKRYRRQRVKRYRWRLRAANGQIVATGHQSFVNKANAKRAAINACRIMQSLYYQDELIIRDLEKEKTSHDK